MTKFLLIQDSDLLGTCHTYCSALILSLLFFFLVWKEPLFRLLMAFFALYMLYILFHLILCSLGRTVAFFIYLFIFIPFLLGFILILIQFLPHTHEENLFLFLFGSVCVCVFLFFRFFPPWLVAKYIKSYLQSAEPNALPRVQSHTHVQRGVAPHTPPTHTQCCGVHIYIYIYLFIYTHVATFANETGHDDDDGRWR